jgi:hypothetical protein
VGYSTDFFGSFKLDKPLTDTQIEYLKMFSDTRRMKRDNSKLVEMFKANKGNKRCFELMNMLNIPYETNGEFYCGTGFCGQDGGYGFNNDPSVIEYNRPPSTQPGLWCQWIPTDDGTAIEWNGTEKFYDYVEWIEYLITNFLSSWGFKVNGMVEWQGEDHEDIGVIKVVDNVVKTCVGKTIKWLEESNKKPESAIASSDLLNEKAKELGEAIREVASKSTSDILLDLMKLRNELSTSKKGTAVACKKIDDLIKKYEA